MKKSKTELKKEDLLREINKLKRQANKQIKDVEKTVGENTWAVRKLRDKLEAETVKAFSQHHNVLANKKMSLTQLRAVNKALQQFMSSKTSTVAGIEEVRQEVIQKISKTLTEDRGRNISYDEAETLYNMFTDNDTDELIKDMGASAFWDVLESAKEASDSEEQFADRIARYAQREIDVDMRRKISNIYYKYVL